MHVDNVYDEAEKIIPFTAVTLENCVKKKEIRMKTQIRASKFDKIILPEYADGTSGYHTRCYKYFCSIKEKKKTVSGNLFDCSAIIDCMKYFQVKKIKQFLL